jgi:phospholipid/cholesterol/gamma-HCH transport system ATP-binding protein
VLENVQFRSTCFCENYRDRLRRARECLARVNLIDAQNKFPGEISGGMRSAGPIARAIVLNPKYLFCDEPNSASTPRPHW